MGIHDQDTDPSTPSALSSAPTDPAQVPGAKASTDPGLGPPSQPHVNVTMRMVPPPTPPQQRAYPALGIVVPSSAPVGPKKDSVELLLEGMQGPMPERPKTMPATDGQASASYHAEHVLRPARTSPDEEPKVVVDRPPQALTTRIDRARVQSVLDQVDAARRASEATIALPQPIAPRLVVAIVAGVTVVLGIFLVFRIASRDTPRDDRASVQAMPTTSAAIPATGPGATPAIGPGATPTGAATGATGATGATPTPPTPTTTADDTAPAPAATTASPSPASDTPPSAAPPQVRASPWTAQPSLGPGLAPRGTAPRATAAPAGDVGEFKTTFH
ncbi:MAG TPA: hypothetical protein VGG39_04320 [Polyangiaceae bacterium]|jgi:hypothetical protein